MSVGSQNTGSVIKKEIRILKTCWLHCCLTQSSSWLLLQPIHCHSLCAHIQTKAEPKQTAVQPQTAARLRLRELQLPAATRMFVSLDTVQPLWLNFVEIFPSDWQLRGERETGVGIQTRGYNNTSTSWDTSTSRCSVEQQSQCRPSLLLG